MDVLRPAGWPEPRGFANGIAAEGRVLFIAGQIGADERGVLASGFVAQVAQALRNIVAIVAAGGGRPEHVARLVWYVTDVAEYRDALRELGEAYRGVMGRHYPAMSVVEVTGLVEPHAKVEIEATAVVPSR